MKCENKNLTFSNLAGTAVNLFQHCNIHVDTSLKGCKFFLSYVVPTLK